MAHEALKFGKNLINISYVFYRTSLSYAFTNRKPVVPGRILLNNAGFLLKQYVNEQILLACPSYRNSVRKRFRRIVCCAIPGNVCARKSCIPLEAKYILQTLRLHHSNEYSRVCILTVYQAWSHRINAKPYSRTCTLMRSVVVVAKISSP